MDGIYDDVTFSDGVWVSLPAFFSFRRFCLEWTLVIYACAIPYFVTSIMYPQHQHQQTSSQQIKHPN
ncbi:hypothetical protein BDU57DRAFT_513912, partial [Ampelomyces quisqualis]